MEERPLIRFRGVKKRFGARVVFNGLDLDVHEGETLTVLGGAAILLWARVAGTEEPVAPTRVLAEPA